MFSKKREIKPVTLKEIEAKLQEVEKAIQASDKRIDELIEKSIQATKKEAIVYKDKSFYWAAMDHKTGVLIEGFHNDELSAYKAANRNGYIVR